MFDIFENNVVSKMDIDQIGFVSSDDILNFDHGLIKKIVVFPTYKEAREKISSIHLVSAVKRTSYGFNYATYNPPTQGLTICGSCKIRTKPQRGKKTFECCFDGSLMCLIEESFHSYNAKTQKNKG